MVVELLRLWQELRRQELRRQKRHLLQLAASIEHAPRQAGHWCPGKTSEDYCLTSKPRKCPL